MYRCVVTSFGGCGSVTTGGGLLTVVPVCCDTIDFNGNDVFPEDQDFVDFLSVLAGADCPTLSCGDVDFNNDGVFPDDRDAVDFLNTLAGGSCP